MIFGIRKSKIYNDTLKSDCGNCNLHQEFIYTVTSNYFHILFIPTFPLGMQNFLKCSFCKTTYIDKEIDLKIRRELKNKIQLKTPVWQWTGAILIALLIIYSRFIAK